MWIDDRTEVMFALVHEVEAGAADESLASMRARFPESIEVSDSGDLLVLAEASGSGLAILLTETHPEPVLDTLDRYEVRLMAGRLTGAAARVFTVQLRPSALQEKVSAFQNLTMRAATGQQGFRGGLLLVDAERERVLSIGIWEDMARLEASAASGYLADQIAAYLPYLQQPPTERRMRVLHLD